MSEELVTRLTDDHGALMEYLRTQGEISFLSTMESSVPKVVLLAAASDLEYQLQEVILTYYSNKTGSSDFAVSFVRNKAVARQYHTYFDWENRSANKFFALFGQAFKLKVKNLIGSDEVLAQAVKDFCELGDLRNQLVHGNYASFVMEKTTSEVHALYRSAVYFISLLPALLDDENDLNQSRRIRSRARANRLPRSAGEGVLSSR
jgi:hypothetical protein